MVSYSSNKFLRIEISIFPYFARKKPLKDRPYNGSYIKEKWQMLTEKIGLFYSSNTRPQFFIWFVAYIQSRNALFDFIDSLIPFFPNDDCKYFFRRIYSAARLFRSHFERFSMTRFIRRRFIIKQSAPSKGLSDYFTWISSRNFFAGISKSPENPIERW